MPYADTSSLMHQGLAQNVAVLFSDRSLAHYVRQAQETEALYAFEDVWGHTKHWLKGEYAYLAVNAACALLHRYNIKHDILHEGEGLTHDLLQPYHTILVPNAEQLAPTTIEALQRWHESPNNRLVVTGKTNLPATILGIARLTPFRPSGYTGWHWTPASSFSDLEAWEPFYVTSYPGYTAHKVLAAPGSSVLAELYEFAGDLQDSVTADKTLIGDGVIWSGNTLYIANQFLEFFGGILQGHLNFETIRHWHHPTHWGDTLAYFFERILKRLVQPTAWQVRLRSFGSYEGVLSLRHDTDASDDLTMLRAEVEHLAPATYNVLDYVISANDTTKEQADTWVRETSRYDFLETALHNHCIGYEWVVGKKLAEHVDQSEKRLGVTLYTLGRHSGHHVHPETLDAMDYLYETKPALLGLCTFCYYNMLEYGTAAPELSQTEPTTYRSDGSTTIAGHGFWWPYHATVTSLESHKTLRGWDLTHEYDCRYDLTEVLFLSHHSKSPRRPKEVAPMPPPWEPSASASGMKEWDLGENSDRLENGVYTIQYHPIFTSDPLLNNGRGSYPWLLYTILLAERMNLWIANKKMLYERMNHYQDIRFRVLSDDQVALYNPTGRCIEELMIESTRPVRSVSDGNFEHIHIVGRRFFTIPPMGPGDQITLQVNTGDDDHPIIEQPNRKGLRFVDARYSWPEQEALIHVRLIGDQWLVVSNLTPNSVVQVSVDGVSRKDEVTDAQGRLKLNLSAARDRFVDQVVQLRLTQSQ